ncbi:MAG: hypothetical protein K9N09_08705 [Candidatus Cloacimonetes bacterium]|nr:hypothetical protein [Candidatus Cloacimonadota bacterium]MCF7814172.1 hypothetical protein [Candidatus Cloacimonadota bacterium]MCF7868765.1 hypothetical protein [Candidatus Cloacimonadota bacterium]MCF7884168.1 hypothetical protein [Candidatus Cloacimonadota bacterium]
MKRIFVIVTLLIGSVLFSQTPTYEFITEPIDLITNYYDYMPGSYNALPIQIEIDGSVYIVFHARETAASTRRIYFSYIDEFGVPINYSTIAVDDFQEGYPGIDLDPVTGDPFVAWHGNWDTATADLEVLASYDLFHLSGPGMWIDPFVVFDDYIQTANAPEDEFIWPEVHIGPSPLTDKRRVYVIGKNIASSPVTGDPSENILIGYADFDVNDLNLFSNLDWSYSTIPLLDQWHNSPDHVRPFLSASVSDDGQIAFIGYIAADFENSNLTDQIIVLHNNNFGEGEFDFYSQEAHHEVWNPTPGTPQQLYFAPYLCNHHSSIFHDGNSKISFLGAMNLLIEPSSWYPDLPMLYTKVFNFDVTSHEFSFYDLYIEGENPSDNEPMIPWDLDEDGIIDSVNMNGDPVWVDGWPIYYPDPDGTYHENNFKITKNEENGWLAAVWNDGLKARYAEEGVAGYDDWLQVPEIAICVSADNGDSWSQPIFLNANETAELAEMIPCYVYPGDKIEDLGNNQGKLHLFFLDDYSWGTSIQGYGDNLGGMQKYCSLEIDFSCMTEIGEELISTSSINLTNFPNPFNPSTEIRFQISDLRQIGTTNLLESAQIDIYNLKGQKVKSLPVILSPESSLGKGSGTPNSYSVVWNGKDDNNKPVSSGVYFAKLKAGNQIATQKMLLMK